MLLAVKPIPFSSRDCLLLAARRYLNTHHVTLSVRSLWFYDPKNSSAILLCILVIGVSNILCGSI